MRFFFLWSDVANKVGVCYFSALRYVFFMNWKYCTCALYAVFNWSVFSYSMGKETAKFIGKAADPRCAVRSLEKCTYGSCSSFFYWVVLEVGNVVGVRFLMAGCDCLSELLGLPGEVAVPSLLD